MSQTKKDITIEDLTKKLSEMFSQDNLRTDHVLGAMLDEKKTVSIEKIQTLPQLHAFNTTTENVIIAAEKASNCSVNKEAKTVKIGKAGKGAVVILRDMEGAKTDDIAKIFENADAPKVINIKQEAFNNFFVTFENDAEAKKAVDFAKSQKFGDKAINARVKSANNLSAQSAPFYPSQPVMPAMGMGFGGLGGKDFPSFGGPGAGGFGNFGPSFGSSQFGNQGFMQSPTSPNSGARRQGGRSNRGRSKKGSKGPRKERDQETKRSQQQPSTQQTQKSNKSLKIASSDEFPTLGKPAVVVHKPGYKGPYTKYDATEISFHIQKMQRPILKPEFASGDHSVVVTEKADENLVSRQRTISMDNVIRAGRPIRTMSVDSVDYRSMMFGQDEEEEKVRDEKKEQRKRNKKSDNKRWAQVADDKKQSQAKKGGRKPHQKKKPAAAKKDTTEKVEKVEKTTTEKKVEEKKTETSQQKEEVKEEKKEVKKAAKAWGTSTSFADKLAKTTEANTVVTKPQPAKKARKPVAPKPKEEPKEEVKPKADDDEWVTVKSKKKAKKIVVTTPPPAAPTAEVTAPAVPEKKDE
eukprot:TRINITY_DN7404_c0_g1_i1.p1 TRINITY_DN7404_c0_g1~~TRINITY_DN7404_c0_g1_i1.p1  ORF type:complete len:578 (-),score=250.33 TRINITY_DN7404_c0_g1_i1:301-2034(-)